MVVSPILGSQQLKSTLCVVYMHGCVNIANQTKSQSKYLQIVFFEWEIDFIIVSGAQCYMILSHAWKDEE